MLTIPIDVPRLVAVDKGFDRQTRMTLIQKMKSSREDPSWEEFCLLYNRYIFAVCRKMALSVEDSEDMVQIVLTKVWEKFLNYEHGGRRGQFRGWLTTVTYNSVVNLQKKIDREARKVDQAGEIDNLLLGGCEGAGLPEIEKIAKKEWGIYISNLAWENIKDSLSEVQKVIFEYSLDGKSRREVADLLNIPVNTVSVYKARVIARLKKEIQVIDRQLS